MNEKFNPGELSPKKSILDWEGSSDDSIYERTVEYITFKLLLADRFDLDVNQEFIRDFNRDVKFAYNGVIVIFALTDVSPEKFIMTPFVEVLDDNLLSSGWSLSPVTVFDGITCETNSTISGPEFDISDAERIKFIFNSVEALAVQQSSSVDALFEKQMAVIKQRFAIKISLAFALSYCMVENLVSEDMEAFDKLLLMGPGMVVLFFIFDFLEKIYIQMKR